MNEKNTPPDTTSPPQNLASSPSSAWRRDLEMPPQYDGTPKSWADLNCWAMLKIHGWREVDTAATIQGITETEKLRLLAFVMLNDSCYFRNEAIRAAETNPAPILFNPNT